MPSCPCARCDQCFYRNVHGSPVPPQIDNRPDLPLLLSLTTFVPIGARIVQQTYLLVGHFSDGTRCSMAFLPSLYEIPN